MIVHTKSRVRCTMPRPIVVATAACAAIGLPQPGSSAIAQVPSEARAELKPLQPGDGLRITFSREPELNGSYFIDSGGFVNLPILGGWQTAGLAPDSLGREIVSAYGEQLRNQTVQILWLRRVRVLGAVVTPGIYHIDPTMTVLDAVALAGGPTPIGKMDEVQIVRSGQVIEDKLSSSALLLTYVESGDQISVPERSWLSRNAGVVVGAALTTVGLLIITLVDD